MDLAGEIYQSNTSVRTLFLYAQMYINPLYDIGWAKEESTRSIVGWFNRFT